MPPRSLAPGLVRGLRAQQPLARIASGVPALDALLGGGIPCGVLTELVGERSSSGRTMLAHRLTAAVTAMGALAACIDLADALDPAHAEAAGIRLDRLLWVRPGSVRIALSAAEHVLETGGFRLVLLDLGNLAAVRPATRQMPTAGAWIRLARGAARSQAAMLIVGVRCLVGTFAALRLEVARYPASAFVGSAACALFTGLTSAVHLRKSRLGPPVATSTQVAGVTG